MARFLSGVPDDPRDAGSNGDIERLFAYYQAKKHRAQAKPGQKH